MTNIKYLKKFVYVDGVRIQLTPHQLEVIGKEKDRREKCKYSFRRMLLALGFKKVKDLPDSFEHKTENWYAEIIDRGNYSDVWMTGVGLKQSNGFPGGWIYGSPKDIKNEVVKALETK